MSSLARSYVCILCLYPVPVSSLSATGKRIDVGVLTHPASSSERASTCSSIQRTCLQCYRDVGGVAVISCPHKTSKQPIGACKRVSP